MNIRLNLLSWRARRRQRRWRYSLLALAMSSLVGGLAWCWRDSAAAARLNAQRQHNQALSAQLAGFNARIVAFEHYAQQRRAQAIADAQLARERRAFVHLLDALAQHTPEGVVLTELHQKSDTLTLTAHAASSTQMAHTVRQWREATLSAITAGGEGGYSFTLSIPRAAFDGEAQLAQMEVMR